MEQLSYDVREAQETELEDLISKAERYLPDSHTVVGLLSIGFRKKMVDENFTKIYIPEDENVPFFIAITGVIRKIKRHSITPFWDSTEITLEDVKKLLKSIPNWSWEEPVYFYNTSVRVLRESKKILLGDEGLANNKLFTSSNLEVYSYKPASFHYKNYLEFLGEEYIVAPLSEKFAPLVHAKWKYYYGDSVNGIRHYMTTLPSVAVFVKEELRGQSNMDDITEDFVVNGVKGIYKPISWALCRHYGEIGFNYTYPEHRNKGLAAFITAAITEKLIQMNLSPFVNVDLCNIPGVKFIEKIGYFKYCPIGYYVYMNHGMSFQDF